MTDTPVNFWALFLVLVPLIWLALRVAHRAGDAAFARLWRARRPALGAPRVDWRARPFDHGRAAFLAIALELVVTVSTVAGGTVVLQFLGIL